MNIRVVDNILADFPIKSDDQLMDDIRDQDALDARDLCDQIIAEYKIQSDVEVLFYAAEQLTIRKAIAFRDESLKTLVMALPDDHEIPLYRLVKKFLLKCHPANVKTNDMGVVYDHVRHEAVFKILQSAPEQIEQFYKGGIGGCHKSVIANSSFSNISYCVTHNLVDAIIAMDNAKEHIEHSRHQPTGSFSRYGAIEQIQGKASTTDCLLALIGVFKKAHFGNEFVEQMKGPLISWLQKLDAKFNEALPVVIDRLVELGVMEFDPLEYMSSCPEYQRDYICQLLAKA